MSLHPLKKSDLSKSWMQKRADRPKKIQPEYHLIVTEGTKTEPEYFTAIKNLINQHYSERIHLEICGKGENTITLFESAKQLAENDPNGCKHVWVVYDKDDFPAEHFLQRSSAQTVLQTDEHTMQFGQINALSCGFYCTLIICNRIFTEANITQS